MLFLELTFRNEIPAALRLAILAMLLIPALLYTFIPNWFTSIRLLAYLPLQRFAWQSEKHTANHIFRISSVLSITIVYAIFIYGYLSSKKFVLFENTSVNFLVIWAVIIALTLTKFVLNKYYFSSHQFKDLGNLVIDYQFSMNQVFSFIIGILLCIDIFYFKFDSNLFLAIVIAVLILFLAKLFGTILMLQNNFTYPILTLFVYLCTFEIVPMLFIAKILFVNS